MKKNYLNMIWLMVAALLFASCSDDDEVTIPKVSLTAEVVTIAENATSALQVKVTTDAPLETAYDVKLNISGTAVAGVNYQEIANTVTIPANQMQANIFVNPINVSAIEENKTLSIEVLAGSLYELATSTSVSLTITDNATPASDAPVVSFATSNIVTNPYLEEEYTITVGLSKAFASALTIPLTMTDGLVAGTDYELAGLDENHAITIAANEVSASFTITMKNTAVVDMDKTVEFGFATPSVTDYAVKATDNTVSVNAVDPQVDFSAWFNSENTYNYFFEDWTSSTVTYRTDLLAYWLKRYYWDSAAQDWSLLSGEHYLALSPEDNNQWKEVINNYQRLIGANGVEIAEQERYEMQANDYLGLTKFFANEATYSKTSIKSEKGWFRFVSTSASATEGIVVVPAQTIILYKIKEGFDWKEKFTTAEGLTHYAWYADSRATQGDLSNSANVTPVSIQVAKSVGTYNSATKEVIVEITFTCDDADFSIDPKYYIANEGNSYTMRIKYINRY